MTFDEYMAGLGPREVALPGVYKEALDFLHDDEGIGAIDVLEVGSGWGIFARAVLEDPYVALTTIDKIPVEGRTEFNERTAGFEDRVERLVGDSPSVLKHLRVKERSFHFAFVDGAHDYETCLADIRLSWEMLRPGGILMVDDVMHKHNWDDDYGVAQAVWDFAGEAGVESYTIARVGSGGVAGLRKPK